MIARFVRTMPPPDVSEGCRTQNEAALKPIPRPKNEITSLVLRTDFSDETAWKTLCVRLAEPLDARTDYVEFHSDPEYEGRSAEQLMRLVPEDWDHSFLLIVDAITLSQPEHSLLFVDLFDQPGRTFRAIPSAVWEVDANLLIANMDFYEYADSVDEDGVFRGFQVRFLHLLCRKQKQF